MEATEKDNAAKTALEALQEEAAKDVGEMRKRTAEKLETTLCKKPRVPKVLSSLDQFVAGASMSKAALRIILLNLFNSDPTKKSMLRVTVQARDSKITNLYAYESDAIRLHEIMKGKEGNIMAATQLRVTTSSRVSHTPIEFKCTPRTQIFFEEEQQVNQIMKIDLVDIPKCVFKRIKPAVRIGSYYCGVITDAMRTVEIRSTKPFAGELFDKIRISEAFVKTRDSTFYVDVVPEGTIDVEVFAGGPEPFDDFDLTVLSR
ncbi:hypothetical protein L596_021652 [Steinernema carpocapsae]|uniref:Uncharacterized protein n=1 Tax=Steinernema carpocapsae TaxID=34508 RepID=A0A4U5MJQ7_STECR|nr:hypothetical protein L596_021652 [Steinernema carpocapsae]